MRGGKSREKAKPLSVMITAGSNGGIIMKKGAIVSVCHTLSTFSCVPYVITWPKKGGST